MDMRLMKGNNNNSDNSGILKVEILLRLMSIVLLVITSCLVALDTETELVFGVLRRKATVKDLDVLGVLVIVESVAAGYNFIQLLRCFFITTSFKTSPKLAWFCFLLDQIAAYVSFATNSAAAQASLLAITGATVFQWLKLCNIYTRFCFQIGGSLGCGFLASLLMVVISCISAFNLFRHYSSKDHLLVFQRRK
ncbi:hypothetical protein MKW94_027399 [Papaver nudicaule]|uniref:CASP-like protein n=1 Tax=Papaver nudicaule TaxID=74823 RepID=A0AA41V220_PAPNU|nr:hypothetical protein [Papaver nudicaule]